MQKVTNPVGQTSTETSYYDALDPYKVEAQKAAIETNHLLDYLPGFSVVSWTRGESVFLIETPFGYLGFVIECLGTKALVAEDMYQLSKIAENTPLIEGRSFFADVAQCTAAMVFNDLITLGVTPLTYGQYLAVGQAEWFDDTERRKQVIEGTKRSCLMARCPWGPGETPALGGIISPSTADMAGGAMGIITRKERLINPENICDGDAIIFIQSSGAHANGITSLREIAGNLPLGYRTMLSDGRTLGESILDPTLIYASAVHACLDRGIKIKYCVNITGHGWRKLMRAPQPFTYVIEKMPQELPIFEFIREQSGKSEYDLYAKYNMTIGYALYVARNQADYSVDVICKVGFNAFVAGHIEKGQKKVVIDPKCKNIVYEAKTLALR